MSYTAEGNDLQFGAIGLVLCQVNDVSLREMRLHLEYVVEEFLKNDMVLLGTFSSFAFGFSGFPNLSIDESEMGKLRRFVQGLQSNLQSNVRVVFGSVNAEVGLIGGPYQFSFGVLTLGIEDWFSQILAVKFGDAAER